MAKTTKVLRIERSTKGIRELLFDEIDDLRSGKTTPQRASAVSAMCGQIINAAKLEIAVQRFVNDGLDLAALGKAKRLPALGLG